MEPFSYQRDDVAPNIISILFGKVNTMRRISSGGQCVTGFLEPENCLSVGLSRLDKVMICLS